MDMAINHSSIEHNWFKEAIKDKNSPYRDYYIIKEGKTKGKKLLPPTNYDSTFTGSAWKNIKGTNDFYMHLFCVEQADLNWENPKLRDEAIDIFNYWLKMGVDGFRLDVFNMFSKVYPMKDAKKKIIGTGEEYYIDGPRMHEFLKELNEKAFSKYDSYTVGESYKPSKEDAINYVKESNHELDSIFNFAHLVSDNIGGAKFFKKKFNLLEFKDGLFTSQLDNYGIAWNTLVLENHDNPRSNCRFGIDTKNYHYEASTFLPTITFLGFGIPYIYMGEEFGMTNGYFDSIDEFKDPVSHFIYNMVTKFHLPKKFALNCIRYGARDHSRINMHWDDSINNGFNKGAKPWQESHGIVNDVSLKKDLEANKSIYRYYQELLKLKKTNNIAINGNIKEYDHNNKKIICYTRELDNEGLLIFGNFSNKVCKYKLPEELKKLEKSLILSNFDSHILLDDTYYLNPYEVLVYSYKK